MYFNWKVSQREIIKQTFLNILSQNTSSEMEKCLHKIDYFPYEWFGLLKLYIHINDHFCLKILVITEV